MVASPAISPALRGRPAADPPRVPSRLASLDGLRAVAALTVVAYHYLYRWAELPGAYPYAPVPDGFWPIVHGSYGVALFFIISGFVISLTLEHCRSLGSFAVRRVARLYPAFVLCTAITWLVLEALPVELFADSAWSFVPSLTMIDPNLLNELLGSELVAMDGAYWSIFAEVKFYLFAGLIYFAGPAHFARNFLLFALLVLGAYNFFGVIGSREARVWMKLVFLSDSLPWFLFGIAFYAYRKSVRWWIWGALIALGYFQLSVFSWYGSTPVYMVAGVAVPAVFLAGLYVGPLCRALSHPALTTLGVASYSLYLLHQFAGVSLIAWLADATGLSGIAAMIVLPLLVTAATVAAALLIYFRVERPLNIALVRRYA